jgi:hypothetical protein
MSIDAPKFDPKKPSSQTQQSSYQQNSEIMRHNIAQMYQYYNQLIIR